MNLQDLITPVGKFVEWTFETVLVPLSNPFNLGVILLVLGFPLYSSWKSHSS